MFASQERREERPRVSQEHFEQIARRLPFPVKELVTLIYETGCRPSEAMRLKWQDVDLERKVVVFNLGKAGDNALVALTSRAAQAIRAVPPLPGCPYVFWNPNTKTCYQRINETFKRASQAANLKWVQPKDFRRAVAIALAESGQALHVAQTQLGHSSIRTTEKYYAHFSPEFGTDRAREALEQRWRQNGGDDFEPQKRPKRVSQSDSRVVDMTEFRERKVGGGERIRTAE